MSSKIWIKLFIEILDDPKMGRLPNHMWRRAVELFLLAGRKGSDGALPPVEEMAWTLRLPQDKLLEDLQGLAGVGVVHEAAPGSWVVSNFSRRQTALSGAERVRNFRERKEDVTERYEGCNEGGGVDSTSTSDSESESDSASEVGVQGEELPRSTVEAKLDPDIKVYCEVTGGRVPGLAQCRQIMAVVRHFRKTMGLDDNQLVKYLSPYWTAWSGRKRQDGRPYDPRSIVWLTEWAMNASIPDLGKERGELHGEEVKKKVDRVLGRT